MVKAPPKGGIQEKRETCSVHPKAGIWKSLAEMNRETITPRCRMMNRHGAKPYKHIYRQNERCLVSTPLLNFPDFAFKDKAKNAFLLRDVSPVHGKDRPFLTNKTTFLMRFCFSVTKKRRSMKKAAPTDDEAAFIAISIVCFTQPWELLLRFRLLPRRQEPQLRAPWQGPLPWQRQPQKTTCANGACVWPSWSSWPCSHRNRRAR